MSEEKTLTIRLRGPLRIVLREGEEAQLQVVIANETSASSRDPQITKALDAMKKDPSRRWTVEALAALVGLSRAAFARRFTRETGTSPLRHLTELRMRIAAERLAESDDALAAIASWIGYESEFAFARAFKRRFGLAPGQFRRASTAAPVMARAA